MRKNEDDRKIIKLQLKKKNKRGLSLSQKFYTLNMKSRHILENLSQNTSSNRKGWKDGSLMQEITARTSIPTSNHLKPIDSHFHFPSIKKR
jgi:hypothetical protein